jgi:Bacterial membrane protein YfhO
MHRYLPFLLILVCFATLFLCCYAPALVDDRQFGYRDAAQYYYPLYQKVQEEWNRGRWPLWEREENAGMPLLGNPTAAVLYPGKLIFAMIPYAWGARVYVMAHTTLAFLAIMILMRSWRTSWVGSVLSGLSYAFGTPILFQYSNVIYLVGAAWLPLGFYAVDRWVRLGRRMGLVGLAIVWAMQTLGGDPQSAYILGWAAGGYAAGIAWSRSRLARRAKRATSDFRPAGSRLWWTVPLAGFGLLGWVAATLALAMWLPRVRPPTFPTPALPWMAWMPVGVLAAWGVAGLTFVLYWRRRGWRFPLGITWLGLAVAAGLAILLTAAQLLPVIEFSAQTTRAVVGPHDLYWFSIEPFRLVELVWPNVMGVHFQGNTHWRDAFNLPGVRPEVWVPWLYLGVMTLMLALGALALRQGPPWRVWLSALVVMSLLGSLGQCASPIWMARVLAVTSRWPFLRDLLASVGPFDLDADPSRLDGFFRDGDGSFYWWMTAVLPGFRQFRFPAKLFTFTALGLAALAGIGWDDLLARRAGRIVTLSTSFLVLSVAVLAGVWICRPAILTVFRAATISSNFGPFDPDGGFRALVRSLAHASIVLGLGRVVVGKVRTSPQLAGACALLLVTADLAVANARCVLTVRQTVLDSKPEALRAIEDEERAHPRPGPFRIHRMPAWQPRGWQTSTSVDRAVDFVVWEHNTLLPKYGINLGVEYTHTFGVGQIYDYEWFFASSPRIVRNLAMAQAMGVDVGKEIVYFPRRSFDIWNTRYFVIPFEARGWRDASRGYASFLFEAERIYPQPQTVRSPGAALALKNWGINQDFQILRNLNEFPRAWVVHQARWLGSSPRHSPDPGGGALQEILYADDPLWHNPTMRAFDPRKLAWVNQEKRTELAPYLSGRPTGPTENVVVSYPSPDRAEIEASLESPGLVILADVYYPGWELTIDGKPAPFYAVNGLMRGAPVPAGTHRLVYSYAPRSFLVGRVGSIVGLGVLAFFGIACVLRPVDPVLGFWDNVG